MFKSSKTYDRYRRLVSLLAPNICPFCGEIIGSTDFWCGECYRQLPFAHGIMPPPDNVSALYACCFYTGRARSAVLMLKYGGLTYPADAFAVMIAARLHDLGAEADVLVPVPNGREGVLKRGYSSSEMIARRLSTQTGIPAEALFKAIPGKREQKRLSAEERRINALSSFIIEKKTAVMGRRILLVDEVCTTGSTLAALGGMLRDAGAAEVLAAVFAKTPRCARNAEYGKYRLHKK